MQFPVESFADAVLPYLRRAGWLLLSLFLAGLCLVAVYIAALLPTVPSADRLRDIKSAEASVLLSLDGTPITTFSRAQQERVRLDEVSPHVLEALLATEDRRFYDHHGVDFRRTVAAMWHTLTGKIQGGSTITQQLARNLFVDEIGRDRTIGRKIREMIAAFRIERTYSKEEILETYLNTVPFPYNVVGIESAARTYFDKPASRLNVVESATLIGMLKGTSYYNPVTNPERAQRRRNVVLAQMHKVDALDEAGYLAARSSPLHLQFTRPSDLMEIAPHFVVQARKWLLDWADRNEFNLYTDGLRIQSTIDLRLQDVATRAVERQAAALQRIVEVEWSSPSAQLISSSTAAYAGMRGKAEPFGYLWRSRPGLLETFIRETPEYRQALAKGVSPRAALESIRKDADAMRALIAAKTRLETGFVAIDPRSGEVRAWVGSRDFSEDQYDHVIQAERQPGSTFKPFVYGAALERGITPGRLYTDVATDMRFSDGTVWRPTNMDGSTGEPMTLRDGLIYSRNTVTAQVMRDVGVNDVVQLAHGLGVKSRLDAVPSLALGTSPVTLMEMVSAYSTIAAQGQYRRPVFIKSIANRHGQIIANFGPGSANGEPSYALSQRTSLELIDMMRGVVNRGTGTAVRSRFGIYDADIAGKTGTTQNNTDGWFIAMHPELVAGAWVGFNDQRVTMRSNYWGQGGHNAVLVVGDFLKTSLSRKLLSAEARFPPPAPTVIYTRHQPIDDDTDPDVDHQATMLPARGGSPAGVTVIRGDANGVVIETPRDEPSMPHAERREARNAQELEKILIGMGRDPSTGAALMPAAYSRSERAPETIR